MSPIENFLLGISVSIYILTAVKFAIYFAPKMEVGDINNNPFIDIVFVVMFLLWPITTIIGIWFLKHEKTKPE